MSARLPFRVPGFAPGGSPAFATPAGDRSIDRDAIGSGGHRDRQRDGRCAVPTLTAVESPLASLALRLFPHYTYSVAPRRKGHTNNPHGRPSLGDAARVTLTVRVSPATSDAIVAEAERREISRGVLLDEIVARALLRKRKTT